MKRSLTSDESIAYDETKPFTDYLAELHEYIEELQDSEIHVGLHVLGQPPEGDILIGEVMHLLRLSNGPVPSLYNQWAEKFSLNFEELEKNPSSIVEAFDLTGGELLRRIRNESRAFVTAIAKNGFTEEAINAAMQLPETAEGPEEWKQKIESLGQYIIEEIYPRLAKTTDEMEHALAALSGKYIPPGPSGSPSAGGVDLLPSGRNFYGVDPRALPSQAGWIAGKKLGDRMIEKYITDEGKYPENIGMVLWSGPNMRSSGQDIAEFLYLLGIKPVWQKGSLRVTDLEVIPLEELKRPRIDVTARISGLFRDTLPHLAELMDKAVLMAAKLDESDDDNFVRKHIREDSEALQADGASADDAWRNAAFRVFGDAPGTYGSGINVVLDAKNWESEKDLADVYVRWGGHVLSSAADSGAYISPNCSRNVWRKWNSP